MSTIPLRSKDHGTHRPASHPVLQAAMAPFDELPELRRERLGTRGSWEAQLIRQVEDAVAALTGVPLAETLLDRYERALTRGHADNLRRVSQTTTKET